MAELDRKSLSGAPWNVMVVDDDQDVLDVTCMVLEDVTFDDRRIRLITAKGFEEARKCFGSETDVAVAFVDVVMETERSGLDLVKFVRDELGNHDTRLIIRTGQPGQAPPLEIVRNLEIDDYREKIELTAERLELALIASLRSYRNLRASMLKSYFVANVSHELRTPLNAIIGMSHLAALQDLQDKVRSYFGNIESAAQHLLGIINDLLDFSRMEHHRLALQKELFDIEGVLLQSVAMIQHEAQTKGLEVSIDVEPGLTRRWVGDAQRLRQILVNYLSNAVKFTHEGQVMLRVREEAGENGCGRLRFEVQDTGIGISPSVRVRLFREFEQGELTTTKRYGGTGLGLAIVRRLAGLMSGAVGVNSEPGQGSMFWVEVQIDRGAEQPARFALPEPLLGTAVLVVDDHHATRRLLSHHLSRLGLEVDTVASGSLAVSAVRQRAKGGKPYRMAFVDWYMPDGDGVQVVRDLRELERELGLRISLIGMTARSREAYASSAQPHDFDAVIAKPMLPEHLGKLIKEHLLTHFAQHQPVRAPHWNRSRTAEMRGATSGRHVLLCLPVSMERDLIVELLHELELNVSVTASSDEAMDALDRHPPWLVLVAVQEDWQDGLKLADAMRNSQRWRVLPLLGLLTIDQTIEADHAERFDSWIFSPVDIFRFCTTLIKWLPADARAALRDAHGLGIRSENELESEVRALTIGGLNAKDGLRRCGNKASLYVGVLQEFLNQYRDFLPDLREDVAVRGWPFALSKLNRLSQLAMAMGATELSGSADALRVSLNVGAQKDATLALTVDNADFVTLQNVFATLLVDLGSWLAEVERVKDGKRQPPDDVPAEKLLVEALQRKLREGDAGAVALFARHRAELRLRLRGDYPRLERSIETFDFELASQLLARAYAI